MGKIQVTVQTEKRLEAINNLSLAIVKVAEALAGGVNVEIKDNMFHESNGDTTIKIDTKEIVNETIIKEIE